MEFDLSVVYLRSDGSFVVNNGLYHVPNSGEWEEAWKLIDSYVKEHPEVVTEEPSPAEPTFDDIKYAKLEEINTAYNVATSSIVVTYPDMEILTFDKQEKEARSWNSDNTVATPFLDGLALARGIDKAELVRRVIAKSDAFQTAVATLTGLRQRYEDQLSMATTAEEVAAIVPVYNI